MAMTVEERFSEYTPIGLCIMSHDYICILLSEAGVYPDLVMGEFPKISAQTYNMENSKEEGSWAGFYFTHDSYYPSIAHTNTDEFIMVDRNGVVYYAGIGKNKDFEGPCLPGYPIGIGPRQIKNIDGTIIGAGVGRSFWMRKGTSDWFATDKPSQAPCYEKISDPGFMALDGFSLDDIYCAGGDKDVWHYNVSTGKWKPIDIGDGRFICNDVLCCKEDGYVYITGEKGLLARGRDDEWEIIDTIYPEDFKNIVYYQDKILIGTERCTFVLQEDLTIETYDFEGELDFLGGHLLYTAHDMLLVGNLFNQIALHDGKKWINVHGCDKLSSLEREMIAQEEREEIKEWIDEILKESDD